MDLKTKEKPKIVQISDCYFENDGRNTPEHSTAESTNESSSLVSLPAELPPPPDGGWGWVIVFVSFLANMTVDGVCYSFSPFMDAFTEYFGESKGKVAWISSLLSGMYLSVGPVVSALTNKYGCRPVCICGALISSFAYAISIFAPSVPFLMLSQGVLAGFGFGLIYLPAVVCVGYYFESKRALATGIAVCGSGVGTMVFPPLVNYLIKTYTWKGANLIISAIILNSCWLGALMRPLEVPKMKRKDLIERVVQAKKIAMESGSFSRPHQYTKHSSADEGQTQKSTNFDPGVNSRLSFSAETTLPVTQTAALPTIEETRATGVAHPADRQVFSESVEGRANKNHSEAAKLLKSDIDRLREEKMARIRSSPLVIGLQNCDNAYKRASVPNFERRSSKIAIMNQFKVIPATENISTANLHASSHDEKSNQFYKRKSIADPESTILRHRRSSSKSSKGLMLPPLSRQDIFYGGSIQNLREFKSQLSMISYRESTFNLQNTSASRTIFDAFDHRDLESLKEEDKDECVPDSLVAPLKEMMDFSMLLNPMFFLLSTANLIGMLGFYTPFVYLPGAAMEKGIDKESATFLVSIIGITNTIGRVLAGFLADMPSVNPLWLNNISIILSGACVFLTPFAQSYTDFVAISVFFGFFVSPYMPLTSILIVDIVGLSKLTQAFGIVCIFRGIAGILGPPVSAAYISLTSIVLVELLGLENLTNAFGLLILFRGSASLVGPPLAGSIYDATQNYDVSFYVAGCLLFLCSLLHCLIPCAQRFCYCVESPVRYLTNEEYLQGIPDDEFEKEGQYSSGDVGVGIMFDIKPKINLNPTELDKIAEDKCTN